MTLRVLLTVLSEMTGVLDSDVKDRAKPATNPISGSEPVPNPIAGPQSRCEPFRGIIEEELQQGLTGQRIYQNPVNEHGRDKNDVFTAVRSDFPIDVSIVQVGHTVNRHIDHEPLYTPSYDVVLRRSCRCLQAWSMLRGNVRPFVTPFRFSAHCDASRG